MKIKRSSSGKWVAEYDGLTLPVPTTVTLEEISQFEKLFKKFFPDGLGVVGTKVGAKKSKESKTQTIELLNRAVKTLKEIKEFKSISEFCDLSDIPHGSSNKLISKLEKEKWVKKVKVEGSRAIGLESLIYKSDFKLGDLKVEKLY